MTMAPVQQAVQASRLRRSPCPPGVTQTGLYGFLDTEWASCVPGEEHCAREFCCVLLRMVSKPVLCPRERHYFNPQGYLLQTQLLRNGLGRAQWGPCLLGKTSRICWSLREYGKGFLNTFSVNSHGKVMRVKLENVKKKKKEQDVGTDYRLYNPIWSHLPTPSLWRDIHSLINVWFLEGYTKNSPGNGNGELEYKRNFYSTLYHPFCFVTMNMSSLKIIKMHLFFVSRYSGHLFIVS